MVWESQDWQIAGGVVTAPEVVYNFENIIKNASQLDTGYIVLAHGTLEGRLGQTDEGNLRDLSVMRDGIASFIYIRPSARSAS